jgi:hypothetical protein
MTRARDDATRREGGGATTRDESGRWTMTSGDRVIDKSWIWDRNADFRARVLTKKLAKSANKAALFADLASFFVAPEATRM